MQTSAVQKPTVFQETCDYKVVRENLVNDVAFAITETWLIRDLYTHLPQPADIWDMDFADSGGGAGIDIEACINGTDLQV